MTPYYQDEAVTLAACIARMDKALRNIRLSAASGRSFGHQATSQTAERMCERKDKALDDILRVCADAGFTGSVLRASPQPLALYRCRVCDARWLFWGGQIEGMVPGVYNLLDAHQKPGPCCDNAPMGDQIEFLRDIIARQPSREPVR